jgi:carboxyl-terminal processing protease
MTRLSRLALLIALGAFWIGGRALAADDKTQPAKTFAVIVGAGEFKDAQIKGRPTAVSDAKTLYDTFTDKTVGAIPAGNVQLLISGEDDKRGAKQATRANILAAVKTLVTKAGKDDRILVAWVGQGASISDRTCLFASDSTFKDRAKNAITAADLEAELKNLKANEVCAMLDLDLKAFTPGKETVLEPNVMDLVRTFLGVKEKDPDAEPPQGRVVILSGGGIQPAVIVDGKEGIFTRAVVEGLRGAADKEGYEPDGAVTVDELNKYLETEVPNLARKYGTNAEAKQQLPAFFARATHFVLSKNPAVTAKVEARLQKLEALAKQDKITKEVAEEGRRLLTRMPTLNSLQSLRKDYQALVDGTKDVKDFLEARDKVLADMKLDDDAARSYAQKLIRGLERFKSVYIKELNLGEMTANAIKGLYRRADQKIPAEIADKLPKVKGLEKTDLIALLQEARLPLGKREDFDKDRDVEISLQYGIAKFVDPYTAYIDRERVEEIDKEVQGFFTGIGVQIRRDLVRDGLLVVTPIKGSPAYAAGLKAGDLITKIRREVDNNGKKLDPPEETSTKGMKVQDAVKLILGKPGTKVKVTIDRNGETPREIEITRGLVEVESVLGYKRKVDDSWDFYLDPKSKIAYIQLTQFARKSFIDMEKIVKQLDKDGVKGLVLDVRFNPGGYLDVARDICDLFIDDGLIVTIKPRVGDEVEMRGKMEPSYLRFPMVCLVNGGSASGSEILAACLQDQHRAIILGERSFGKGSVQNIQKFEATGGEIKLTTATFWRPNGKNLNKASTKGTDAEDWGVRPDKNYTIKLSPQETAALSDRFRDWGNIPNRETVVKEPEKKFDDRQLDAAVEYIRAQIKLVGKDTVKKEKG